MNRTFVAPSLLAANPLKFEEELLGAEKVGIDMHHVDVMDGHFVPNLSYGLPLIKAIKSVSKVPLDVHIMVANPDIVALDYVEAGADLLVFHIEAAIHPHRLLQAIKSKGAKAGLAINPGTPVTHLEPLLPYVDIVNVMSVNPGFGGQKFIEQTPKRVRAISNMLKEIGREKDVYLEVDGGITEKTAPLVKEAGANLLVAGTFFYGSSDKSQALAALKG